MIPPNSAIIESELDLYKPESTQSDMITSHDVKKKLRPILFWGLHGAFNHGKVCKITIHVITIPGFLTQSARDISLHTKLFIKLSPVAQRCFYQQFLCGDII